MAAKTESYPATLEIDYPTKRDRLSTFLRLIYVLPILVIISLLTASGGEMMKDQSGEMTASGVGGIVFGLFAATALMIVFRQRYPRWWFDFNLELNRFSTRVSAYLLLLSDQYPSTVEKQSVHLELVYPDVKQDLNRWLPLVKWFLALPHYLVLFVLAVGVLIATVVAWFAILLTGRYPKDLFDFVVDVNRWGLRVFAYAFLLTTDQYPPFRLR